MKLRDYGDMNLQELDVMKEIGSIGTSHAATALSNLLNKEVGSQSRPCRSSATMTP